MAPQSRQIETGDGRRLRVEIAGDSGRVVLAQVGTPNAGVLYDDWVRDAAARDVTLISYDRPGYGGSSPQPGRTVADCAADVRSISEAVGFDRCAVWGFSGGGPHALACAALLGNLVAAVATIGSPAPFDAPGLDYFAGQSEEAREDIELFLSDRPAWEHKGEGQRDELLALGVDGFREQWSAGVSPADVAELYGGFGDWLHRSARASLEPGVEGWKDDNVATESPWGFDPASISVPVKVWHGLDDHFVPIGHGRWLASSIPGAEAELRDGDGHLVVAGKRIADVHEWLVRHL
jgi:pimeloyl-ACP methyl ester carboxylesterase